MIAGTPVRPRMPLANILWPVAVVAAFGVGWAVGRGSAPAPTVSRAFVPYPVPAAQTNVPTPEPVGTPWSLGAPELPATTVPTLPAVPVADIGLTASARPWEAPSLPPSPDASRTEAHWQGRLFESRDRIQAAYQKCVAEFRKGDKVDPRSYGMAWTEDPSPSADLEGARATLITALTSQVQLEEAARRAGVPAGWVRFDWSGYPRLTMPKDQPGASVAEHPCSVPDLLRNIHD